VARSRFPVRSTRAPRRKTVWVGAADAAPVAVANNTSVLISSFSPDDLGILAATVVRTRGRVLVRPTAFGADQSFDGAYGLGVVSDEAFVAGAASIPRPFDDDDWTGWMVHGYWSEHLEFQGAQSEMIVESRPIDSKAMRKIRPNETLVWVAESRAGNVTVQIPARVLMMLS